MPQNVLRSQSTNYELFFFKKKLDHLVKKKKPIFLMKFIEWREREKKHTGKKIDICVDTYSISWSWHEPLFMGVSVLQR